jgi:hypothetical protein
MRAGSIGHSILPSLERKLLPVEACCGLLSCRAAESCKDGCTAADAAAAAASAVEARRLDSALLRRSVRTRAVAVDIEASSWEMAASRSASIAAVTSLSTAKRHLYYNNEFKSYIVAEFSHFAIYIKVG